MRKLNTIFILFIISLIGGLFSACNEFLDPEQEINITENQIFDDWYEYRSVEMGLYALQQDLVEQLVILGELRGDLLTITKNADADLVEIYNFNVTKSNKYASPTKFFKLISAANNFIKVLEEEHPEVLNPDEPISNYDRLYGEALCMRAWAYFNAVRIYGKVPFIHQSLVTINEIESFINTPGTYVDSIYIDFALDGYYNDTTYNVPIELEKNYWDTDLVIDYFTNELETKVKAVGVNHYIENNDNSWEITIWNEYAMHSLLGQMYLTQGDLRAAHDHFHFVMHNNSTNLRYRLDNTFETWKWRDIFTGLDNREHIFSLWFNKANFQQNDFQKLFDNMFPHKYMLKPSGPAIAFWESVFRYQQLNEDLANPENSEMGFPGLPGDWYRGYGSSYLYLKKGFPLSENEYIDMLFLKAAEDYRSSAAIMEDVDTMVYKYSVNKGIFDQDADFHVYRAAGIHLYMAEVLTYWAYDQNGIIRPNTNDPLGIINAGSYYDINNSREEMGIRGRVGLGNPNDRIRLANYIYIHHPFTNEIIGYKDLTGNLLAKQKYLEEEIMKEKARELAFEGERFYDLIRVAKRRNDPAYLAKLVSAKYPDSMKDNIYNLLLDEKNWYINYFDQ